MTDETHLKSAPQPDPLGNAAAVIEVLALLRVIADPAESKARLDALRAAKTALDDRLVQVSRREQEVARRETAVDAKLRDIESREVAVARRAADLDEVGAAQEAFAARLRQGRDELTVKSAQVDAVVARIEASPFSGILQPLGAPAPGDVPTPGTHGRQPGSQRHQFRKAEPAAGTAA